jgi:tetratricopeptide (TPR) repeat protein/O-antigen ligase
VTVSSSRSTDHWDARSSQAVLLDAAIEVILVGMLAFAPWPFGSITRWSEEILIGGAACLGVCFAARLLVDSHFRLTRSWAYLPIGFFLSLSLLQLVPFLPSALHIISPHTVELKTRLLSDIPGAGSSAMTITFYRWATWHDLRLALALSVTFIVTLNTFRGLRGIKRLLISICVIGGAVAALAVAQDLSGAAKIYWYYRGFMVKAIGGPFLNHSHFCQYLSLTIGAAVALLLMSLSRADGSRHRSESLREPQGAVPWLPVSLLTAVILLAGAAIGLSLSRAGMLAALFAAGIIAATAAFQRRRRKGWAFVLSIAAIIFIVTLYLEGEVSQRLATLRHPVVEYDVRWQIIKDICAAWPRFPLFGIGLGNHEFAYPMFEHLIYTPVFDHAENEFAQMLEETGALGLAAVLGFLMVVGTGLTRAIRTGGVVRAAGLGLGFGLIEIVLQSCFDFGQHIPATALLTSVQCALLINLAKSRHSHQRATPLLSTPTRFPVIAGRWAGAIAVTGAFVVSLCQADRARAAERLWAPARSTVDRIDLSFGQLSKDDFRDIADDAAAAHHADPDDLWYLYQMANYRWSGVEMYRDRGLAEDSRTPDELRLATVTCDTFNQVRLLCPCYGLAIFMTGQIEYFVFDLPQGADLVRLAYEITPTNLQIVIQAADIDARQGRVDEAVAACRHYLSLQGAMQGEFAMVAYVLVHEAQRPDLAINLAENLPDRLESIVAALRDERLQRQAADRRRAVLIERCSQPGASVEDLIALAEIYRSEHQYSMAVDGYRRALVQDYGNIPCRLSLAAALVDEGRKAEALEEVSIALRLNPQSSEARSLYESLDSADESVGGK